MKVTQEFFGFNPVMWMGVVEDIEDPIKLGRLRVRIFGWHTQNTTGGQDSPGVAISDLPWAQVMQPAHSAPNSGVGGPVTGIVKGTWVMGFFMDGEIGREPLVIGSLPGIPMEYSQGPTKGFYDPDTIYPRKHPTDSWDINEPDTNRLARNDDEFEHQNIETKKKQQVTGVGTARGLSWEEPVYDSNEASPGDGASKTWADFKVKYPYNHVYESESGHIIEVDDTPGGERLHMYHRTGTYVDIDKDGRLTTKVTKRKVNVTVDDELTYTGKDWNLTSSFDINMKCRNMLLLVDAYTLRTASVGVVEGGLFVFGKLGTDTGATGTFTSKEGRTVTVVDGIVTKIK